VKADFPASAHPRKKGEMRRKGDLLLFTLARAYVNYGGKKTEPCPINKTAAGKNRTAVRKGVYSFTYIPGCPGSG